MLENIRVGKYALESLTTGMRSDPMSVYRECIQNSADSLEAAARGHLLDPKDMRIDVVVDEADSRILIRDNGTGIDSASAASALTDIGSSRKRGPGNRGFRGIGRLAGMGYCGKLSFATSAEGEGTRTIVEFDCEKLRGILAPGSRDDMDLEAILKSITRVRHEDEKRESRYFVAEMREVCGTSGLLDFGKAKSYIEQVAPLPYKPGEFAFADELHLFLRENGYEIEEFPIFLGRKEGGLEPAYKPNRHRYRADGRKMKEDEILSLRKFRVEAGGRVCALGWYGASRWLGTLCDPGIAGIRVRRGNMMVGDGKTLNQIFKEARFNGWAQGEIFVTDDGLIPNARGDDFERNDAYMNFIGALRNGIGTDIPREIRKASAIRNGEPA